MSDQPNSSPREALRRELEETHAAYHRLLARVDPPTWRRKSTNPEWTVGELLSHLADVIVLSANTVQMARQGRSFSPPSGMTNWTNTRITRMTASKSTPQSVAARYDTGHAKVMALLQEIGDDEWEKGARILGRDTSVTDQFHNVAAHFAEHERDILPVLE